MTATGQRRAWTAALAFALAGALGLTAYTVRATPSLVRQVTRRHADLMELFDLARGAAAARAAQRTVEAAGQGAPPLAALIKDAAPGIRADLQERETRALTGGWSAHRVDVMLNDVNLAEAGRLMERLESARPPWRVGECQITAAESVTGRGRITLVVEGLDRSARGSTTP